MDENVFIALLLTSLFPIYNEWISRSREIQIKITDVLREFVDAEKDQ